MRKCLLCFVLVQSVFWGIHPGVQGAPGAGPQKDYYRLGMDAGKVKDYGKAARYLKLAYSEKPSSYIFFWYLYHLSLGKYDQEIIQAYEKSPAEHHCSEHYGSKTAGMAAAAYKKAEKMEQAVATLMDASRSCPVHRNEIDRLLLQSSGVELSYGEFFRRRADYESVLQGIVSSYKGRHQEDKSLARYLYLHLIDNAARDGVAGRKEKALSSLMEAGRILEETGALGDVENHANFEVMKRALEYYLSHSNKGNAYPFRYFMLFINQIDAVVVEEGKSKRVTASLSDYFIQSKIQEMVGVQRALKILYYYFSRGQIDMSLDFMPYQGKITHLNQRPGTLDIEQNSLVPYPQDLIYEKYPHYDGVGYLFPTAGKMLYLGGGGRSVLVPYLIESGTPEFSLKALCGAALSVLVHEVFHGFESFYKLSSPAHLYSKDNMANWPAWYKGAVDANENTIAEWVFYEKIFEEKFQEQEGRFPARQKVLPSREGVEKAAAYLKKRGSLKMREAYLLMQKALDFRNQKKFTAAEQVYQTILKKNPDHPKVLFNLAYIYQWNLDKRDLAQKHYDRYLKLYAGLPETFTAAIYSCVYYFNRQDMKRVGEIAESIEPLMRSKNDIYHIRMQRIKAYLRTGKKDQALGLLKEGSEDPENPIRDNYQTEWEKNKG